MEYLGLVEYKSNSVGTGLQDEGSPIIRCSCHLSKEEVMLLALTLAEKRVHG